MNPTTREINEKNKKKSCKTCAHASFQRTEKGNIRRSVSGECTYQVRTPLLPESVTKHFSFREEYLFQKSSIWADGRCGSECLTHKAIKQLEEER